MTLQVPKDLSAQAMAAAPGLQAVVNAATSRVAGDMVELQAVGHMVTDPLTRPHRTVRDVAVTLDVSLNRTEEAGEGATSKPHPQ